MAKARQSSIDGPSGQANDGGDDIATPFVGEMVGCHEGLVEGRTMGATEGAEEGLGFVVVMGMGVEIVGMRETEKDGAGVSRIIGAPVGALVQSCPAEGPLVGLAVFASDGQDEGSRKGTLLEKDGKDEGSS